MSKYYEEPKKMKKKELLRNENDMLSNENRMLRFVIMKVLNDPVTSEDNVAGSTVAERERRLAEADKEELIRMLQSNDCYDDDQIDYYIQCNERMDAFGNKLKKTKRKQNENANHIQVLERRVADVELENQLLMRILSEYIGYTVFDDPGMSIEQIYKSLSKKIDRMSNQKRKASMDSFFREGLRVGKDGK